MPHLRPINSTLLIEAFRIKGFLLNRSIDVFSLVCIFLLIHVKLLLNFRAEIIQVSPNTGLEK